MPDDVRLKTFFHWRNTDMRYTLSIPGFENRELMLETGGFWSGPKLMIDGAPAPKGPKRGQFSLRRNDGTEAIAQLRVKFFLDPLPQVELDGQSFLAAEPLKWYEWLWAGLPFAMIIIGGALGGGIGGLMMAINGRVFRSNLKTPAKYLLTGSISAGAFIAYFLLALLLNFTIHGLTPKVAQEFRSETGGFSIMTPYILKETTQSLDTQAGKIEVHSFIAGQAGDSYLVGYSDYPAVAVQASDPQKILDGSRDGAVANVKGELVSEIPITLSEYPGRDLTITVKAANGQELFLRGRIYLVGNRLYQIIAVVTKSEEKSVEMNNFLQSFKLLGK
jgi:hypothetical protein